MVGIVHGIGGSFREVIGIGEGPASLTHMRRNNTDI